MTKKCLICTKTQIGCICLFKLSKALCFTLSRLTDVEIQPNDSICQKCKSELEIVHKFRKKCIQSDLLCRRIAKMESVEPTVEPVELIQPPPLSASSPDLTQLDTNENSICFESDPLDIDAGLDAGDEDEDYAFGYLEPLDEDDTIKVEKSKIPSTKKAETREWKFHCDYEGCNKRFYAKVYLSGHKKRMHSNNARSICSYCGNTYMDFAALRRHETITHEKVPPSYACRYCSRWFHRREIRAKHEKRHVGDPKFICDVCSSRFYDKYKLSQHMMVHTGVRPFKCELCPFATRQRANLQDHIRKKHKVQTG